MSRLFALTLLLTALAAGCGDDADTSGDGASAPTAEASAFPVTIQHKFGETTITEAPKRVVVAGLREQDSLLALGVVPVATTEWYGNHPGAIFPWAEEALGDAPKPTVLGFTDGIQFEKVAAQRPDLILAVYSGLKQKDYDTLSKIAPTVAQPPDEVDWGSSWQEELLTTGKAIGKPEEAEKLKDETEAKIAAAGKAHPDFADQTAAVATPYEGIYVYGPQDARSRFLTDLGFTFPKALEAIGGKEGFGGQLSAEKVDLLDVGTLVWITELGPADTIRENAVYSRLAVHKQGRDYFMPEKSTLSEATSFPSVLSIPLLLDELVPKLAAAADGDPGTKVDSAG